MEVKKVLMTFAALLVISGCGQKDPGEQEVVKEFEYVEQTIPKRAKPRPAELSDVEWFVVTEENLEEFKTKFKERNGKFVFVATTVKGYERIALNYAELNRYIEQQNSLIAYYENFAK